MLSCGGAPSTSPDAGANPFIAFARDFDGYQRWAAFRIDGGTAQAASHVSGDRTVYLNRRPAHGATSFSVGTLIVKEVTAQQQVFAMAKRGEGFNSDGALGWEWFELEGTPDQLIIRWRGLGPPTGEGYGGPGNSGCNNCHTGAWDNDFVQAEPLRLTGF